MRALTASARAATAMQDALTWLHDRRVPHCQMTTYQIKIGPIGYFPGKDTIFVDRDERRRPHTGLDALAVVLIEFGYLPPSALASSVIILGPITVLREHDSERGGFRYLAGALFVAAGLTDQPFSVDKSISSRRRPFGREESGGDRCRGQETAHCPSRLEFYCQAT